MLPSAVAEQQAKLGVSAEESKAQRLKRQQARFRDRGGAFVPSNSNPLLDLLLARTVSGESPSKPRPKAVAARRSSPRKRRETSPARKAAINASEKSQPIAGGTKSKGQAPRKRKANHVEPEEPTTKPAPKRRGRLPKAQKKVPEIVTGEPSTKAKVTSKGKSKQRNTTLATSHEAPRQKTKANPNSAKVLVEVLVSDNDQTLIDVPHKTNHKRKVICEDDDNVPPVRTLAGKNKPNSDPVVVKPAAEDDGQPPVPKPKKRKKEEDNYDDRPQKAVKFSDTGPPHSSSKKLKENQSDTKRKRAVKASLQDEPDASCPKLMIKPSSRLMASKGPPREVLERIKASAARHLNRADNEPDELDCLS